MPQIEKEASSFRFAKTVKKQLAELAEATGRSQTFLVEDAVKQYCEIQSWQVGAIKEAIREADAGKGIPHEKLKRKWEKRIASLMDASRRAGH